MNDIPLHDASEITNQTWETWARGWVKMRLKAQPDPAKWDLPSQALCFALLRIDALETELYGPE